MRITRSILALAGVLHLVGGCGPAHPPVADVAVVFNADPGKIPFDPHGARLRAATNGLAEVVGRKMKVELDVALVREFAPWFETGLVTAVENAAHDLGEIKRTRPEAWAQIGPRLRVLAFRYDGAARRTETKLSSDGEKIEVTVPADATSFLPHEAALLALEAQYDATLPERYANGVPRGVSIAEKRAYFRALTGQKPPPNKPDDPRAAPGISNEVRPLAIERAIRFYDVPMPTELRAEIHEWLLNEGHYFRDAYVVYPDAVKAAPPSSPFHRAETAWVDWVKRNDDRFTDAERVALAKMVFVKAPRKERGGAGRHLPFAFPGLDRVTFGMSVFEEWAALGYPEVVPGRDRLLELFDFVVCPLAVGQRGERVVPPACEHDFYGIIADSEAAEQRFLDFMLAQKSELLVETAFVNLMRIKATGAVFSLWRGLEADEKSWTAATRTIADEMVNADAGRLADEALRLWDAYPSRRGSLLYLLSQIDRYGNDSVAWGALGDMRGARASAADFAAFLAHGRRAMATAWIVWPLLARGFSRADVIVPHLDRFLDDPLVPSYHPQDPALALQQIASRMCAEKGFGDLAKLHAYFEARIRQVPAEQATLGDLLEETARGRCKPGTRPVARAAPLEG